MALKTKGHFRLWEGVSSQGPSWLQCFLTETSEGVASSRSQLPTPGTWPPSWAGRKGSPLPAVQKPAGNGTQADRAAPQRPQLRVAAGQRGGEGRHVDGVAERLVAGGVDHVAQRLLGVLDAAALGVAVAQKHQLLLLPRPQATHTLTVDLRATRKGQGAGTREGAELGAWAIPTLMTRKLRWRRLSMMILYSSEASSRTWRRASSEGVLLRMALRQAGSPSCEMTSRSSLAAMASYRAAGSSYSSGDVKWSWGGGQEGRGQWPLP